MNLLDENGILDLRNYNKDFLWWEHKNIIHKIKGFNIKGYKYDIDFEECKLFNKINHLDFSDFKGKYISFVSTNIDFDKINIVNNKSIIDFCECIKINKSLQKEFDLSKGLDENIELVYFLMMKQ